MIRLLLAGRSRFLAGEASVDLRPLAPLIFSLGEPFRCDRTTAEWLSLYIPRDSFPDLPAGLGLLGPGVVDNASSLLLGDLCADVAIAVDRLIFPPRVVPEGQDPGDWEPTPAFRANPGRVHPCQTATGACSRVSERRRL